MNYKEVKKDELKSVIVISAPKDRVDKINAFIKKNREKEGRIITWSEPIRIPRKS